MTARASDPAVRAWTWERTGSPLIGPSAYLTAVARGSDRIDLFGVGVDSAVWTTAWTRQRGWDPDWANVVPSGRFGVNQRVAALSRDGVGLDLFVVDDDGAVAALSGSPEQGWSDWVTVFPGAEFDPASQHVTAVSRTPDRIELFGVGVNEAVWTVSWTEDAGWEEIGSAVAPVGRFGNQRVAAVSRRPQSLELFVVGPEESVWTATRTDGTEWNGWDQLPPGAGFDPATQQVAAVAPGAGRAYLFAIGANDAVWCENSQEDLVWNAEWSTVSPGGVFDHAAQNAAALVTGPNRVEVYAIARDGTIRTHRLDGAVGGDEREWDAVPGGPPPDPAARLATLEPGADRTEGWLAVVDDGSEVWVATAPAG